MITLNTLASPELPIDPSCSQIDFQLAAHQARMALARWGIGISYPEMQVLSALGPNGRSQWLAQAQEGFTQWLAAGGFRPYAENGDMDADMNAE